MLDITDLQEIGVVPCEQNRNDKPISKTMAGLFFLIVTAPFIYVVVVGFLNFIGMCEGRHLWPGWIAVAIELMILGACCGNDHDNNKDDGPCDEGPC